MKIKVSKSRLKQIIQEEFEAELQEMLNEAAGDWAQWVGKGKYKGGKFSGLGSSAYKMRKAIESGEFEPEGEEESAMALSGGPQGTYVVGSGDDGAGAGDQAPGADDAGAGVGGAKGPAVPIRKYSPETDPKTGKRLQPLSSKLAKAGSPKHVVNTILRSIVKQLQANNVQITESVFRILLEGRSVNDELLERRWPGRVKRKALGQAARETNKPIVQKMKGGFVAQRAAGEQRKFHQIAHGQSLKKAKAAAWKWAKQEDAGTSEEAPALKGSPESWRTQGGAQEEWDALLTKEKFVFLKMPKNKQSKFFKMSSEQRMELYNQLKAAGPRSKSDIGAEKTSAAQSAAGEVAAARGLKPEQGTIKISTLNQQLKTISPPADDKTRKTALNIVQQHLTPYLKKHKLKFSEQKLVSAVVNIIVEVRKMKIKNITYQELIREIIREGILKSSREPKNEIRNK